MAKESTLYYFYSVGCGWCKKTEPLVDELNESGDYENTTFSNIYNKR